MDSPASYRYDLVNRRNEWLSWGAQRLLGYTQAEIHAMGSDVLATIIHQDDWHLLEQHTQRLQQLQLGEPADLCCRGWGKRDKHPRFLQFRDVCVAHDGQQCTAVEGQIMAVSVGSFDSRKMLERGLLRQEITLHYQPICDLKTGAVVGYEALSRWIRPGHIVSPADFLPLIEGTSLEVPWIRHQVSLVEAALLTLPDHLWIALNVSTSALLSGALPSILGASPCPDRIHIEVLESVSIRNPSVIGILDQMRTASHLIFADDVGEMESLSRFLSAGIFDGIKLDKALVEGLPDSLPVAVVSRHILNLAKDLGLPVIAEWVQTQAQVEWLVTHGCYLGQGALFGLAAPLKNPDQ